MNYAEAGAWLYGAQLRGVKLGLDNTRALLARLGIENRSQRFLHVAGTNGKGSVCAILDAICRAGGIRTGLFTSPHLVTFRERIRIDGQMIAEDEVAASLTDIREIAAQDGTEPTFFEIVTALALGHFQRNSASVVVLETGLGGRFDATNVVTPAVSVLASIDFDHEAWLGSTLAAIAGEKAGIIKPGVPAVSLPQRQEAAGVILEAARVSGSPLRFIGAPIKQAVPGLPGSHQKWNAALAVAALEASGIRVPEGAVEKGISEVQWPGRFQIIEGRHILDGAHNKAAAERLALTWKETYGDAKATVILGILKDKDVRAICAQLLPVADAFIVCPVRSARSLTPLEVADAIHASNPDASCTLAPDLSAALEIARRRVRRILITGSLFLVGEALSIFEGSESAPEFTLQ